MLHRIVRLSGFGSEIRVTIVSHEDNQLEYQGFGFKEKEKGGQGFFEIRKARCSDVSGNKKGRL